MRVFKPTVGGTGPMAGSRELEEMREALMDARERAAGLGEQLAASQAKREKVEGQLASVLGGQANAEEEALCRRRSPSSRRRSSERR